MNDTLTDLIGQIAVNHMLRLHSENYNIRRNHRIHSLLSRRYYNTPPLGGYVVSDEEEYVTFDMDDITSITILDTLTELNNNTLEINQVIKTKLSSYKKVKCDNTELLNSQCPICIDTYKPTEYYRKLNCEHIFHKKCIDRWIKRDKNECPMCRDLIIN